MTKRKAAKRPAIRTVHITLDAPFEGWEATLRADVQLKVLGDLGSDDIDRVVAALDRIVLDHNFPDEHDEVATSMGEVDPSDAVTMLSEKYGTALSSLPPR